MYELQHIDPTPQTKTSCENGLSLRETNLGFSTYLVWKTFILQLPESKQTFPALGRGPIFWPITASSLPASQNVQSMDVGTVRC